CIDIGDQLVGVAGTGKDSCSSNSFGNFVYIRRPRHASVDTLIRDESGRSFERSRRVFLFDVARTQSGRKQQGSQVVLARRILRKRDRLSFQIAYGFDAVANDNPVSSV